MKIAETLSRCEQCVLTSIATVAALKASFPDSLPLEKIEQELNEWKLSAESLKKANIALAAKNFKASALIHQFKAMSLSSIKEM